MLIPTISVPTRRRLFGSAAPRSRIATTLCISVITFAALLGTSDAAVTLSVAGSAFPLVATRTGGQNIRVEATATAPISGASVIIDLRDYQGATVVATGAAPLGPSAGLQALQVPINVPMPGLYDLTARVVQNGTTTLATATTSYGIVPNRNAVGPSDFGVCTHFAQGKGALPLTVNLVKLAGFSHIRDEVYWNSVETALGVYQFPAGDDNYINAAFNAGLDPLVILDFGNPLYPHEFDSTGLPSTDAGRTAFANYAKQCVMRYGSMVKHWEVWNEPKPEYDVYSAMLQATYSAVKQADPSAYVISCGGGGAGGGAGGDYISGVRANGGFDSAEGYSIHPYMDPSDPDHGYAAPESPLSGQRVNVPSVMGWHQTFINLHPQANGAKAGLWVTEIGWSSDGDISESSQAAYLTRTYLLSRRVGIAQAVFVYDFQNDGVDGTKSEQNFGLVRLDFSPKPSYVAVATLTSTIKSLPWSSSLLETSAAKVFRYGSGADFAIAAWTVAGDTEAVALSLPSGTYTLRDWQGRETTVASINGSLSLSINGTPRYILPLRFETESLAVSASSGASHRVITGGNFSGGAGTVLDARAAGDSVTYTVPNVAIGTYDVRVGVKRLDSHGLCRLAAARSDSTTFSNIGSSQDLYSTTEDYVELDLGTWSPATVSDKSFRFTVTGKNAASSGYAVGLDAIRLIPQ